MSTILRRPTRTVLVGGIPVGSAHPVVVQSMTNTDTADADATAIQVAQLAHAGSELVRITVNNDEAAEAVPVIRSKLDRLGVAVPLIGDFHYNGHLLLTKYPAAAAALAKYRINPGNVGTKRRDEQFAQIIEVAIANRVVGEGTVGGRRGGDHDLLRSGRGGRGRNAAGHGHLLFDRLRCLPRQPGSRSRPR